MTSKKYKKDNSKGLSSKEVLEKQKIYGKNKLTEEESGSFLKKILDVLKEPMFLLLIVASIIYFILGEPRDGAIMLIFVIGIIAIDVIQEWKTDKTLNALKNLSAPCIRVIRDGEEQIINSENLVPGDLMIIEEGVKIPADGTIIEYGDLAVNESSLTGESEVVWKNDLPNICGDYWRKDYCYAGTLVTQGSAIIRVEKIGEETEYGKIGNNITKVPDNPTPLQKQTRKLVKVCALIALVFFILVCIITYLNLGNQEIYHRIIESILSGVTLAMAMIPEEFPVILTVFLSMGAWRLAKKKSLVRKLPAVETLGAVSVLCVDKTGTITRNKMSIDNYWTLNNNKDELFEVMGLACDENPYDPMEQGILEYCHKENIDKEKLFDGILLKEYAFNSERKMKGRVWRKGENIIMAAKGSPEKILAISDLSEEKKEFIEKKVYEMSKKGLRVIAVASNNFRNEENIPFCIEQSKVNFIGLIGFLDPPREGIKEDINSCIKAGIRVVMITGDGGVTASSIAEKIGMKNINKVITGEELSKMSDEELKDRIKDVNIFSRVLPEHKMRIVKSFKERGEIVAMTGDGVNDAAALKYADIGIAMGKRGCEVSREAADLILLDDDFSTIVKTIKDGRRIYDNIRKAVGYIFTIHIPIAFSSLLAPLLGINSSMLLLLPLHVVILEILIDPTCSIVLERQPVERDIMMRNPRNPNENMITFKILFKSILQGIILFVAAFGTYYFYLKNNIGSPEMARAMGLSIIILSNLFLVQVNSSNRDLAIETMFRLKNDPIMWAIGIGTIVLLAIVIYSPLAQFLGLTALPFKEILIVLGVSIISVMWYEVIKIINKIRRVK